MMRNWIVTVIAAIAVAGVTPAFGQQGADRLKIKVIEGDGALNNVKRGLAQNILAEVQDEDGKPVKGAEVTFTMPFTGPGAMFPGGGRTLKVVTDELGRARTEGMKPNTIEGRFNIKITAVSGENQGSTVISQSNTQAGGSVAAQGGGRKTWLVLAASGAAAAGSIFAFIGRGGGSGSAAPPTPTILTVGGVSVGGPR